MMITLYGIANCDTVRRTRQWLQQRQIDFEFHDYKKQGCPAGLIDRFLQHFDYQELVNKRGTTWRKLPDAVRDNLSADSARQLMQEQPSIIKRPILEVDGQWLLGYDSARMEEMIN